MQKLISASFLGLILLSAHPSPDKPQKLTATLVEIRIHPPCAGLDCPPPPLPSTFGASLCFQVNDAYYVGSYVAWQFPWTDPEKKLGPLRGQPIEIVLTNKHIHIVAPVSLRLRRIHNDQVFTSNSCNQA